MSNYPVLRPASEITDVYLYRDPIDFRKAHRGLVALIEVELGHNPYQGGFYVFTNRQRNKIKCIFWEETGFVLYYKCLSEEKFKWPKKTDELVVMTGLQLNWLLDGYDVLAMKPLKKLEYESSF